MAKNDNSKLYAFLGVLLTVIGFIIVYATQKKDKYAMFYAKQGLILFLFWIIVAIVGWIPIIGWILGIIGWILLVIAWIIGLIYSLSGEQKDIPVIGVYSKFIKL